MYLDLRKAPWRRGCFTAILLAACVATAGATQSRWNDKTVLTFSEPVLVPDATLQPGKYVFKLTNSSANRHLVQIATEDGKVVALTQAVPMKRLDPKGDIVVKFNPTVAGTPPALKGWFTPGSIYGHEFVYPDEQAKDIAKRTKTIVLSIDVPGTDLEKGTLRTYNAEGVYADWRGDPATMTEWRDWESKRATAPMIDSDFQATRVKIGDLEDRAANYIGKTVSVDAEVDRVYGPRLFTIDEPNWGDLEGEILVYLSGSRAAPVREDDRVTITGTVKRFVSADVEREWGWLGLDREIEAGFAKRPILVATRIVGGNDNLAMMIDIDPPAAKTDKPVGTAGNRAASPLSDLGTIVRGDEPLIGRRVDLTGVKIERMAKGGGFFARTQNETLFILPASRDKSSVATGDMVAVKGIVLQMPDDIDRLLSVPAADRNLNDEIYVYATNVSKTQAST